MAALVLFIFASVDLISYSRTKLRLDQVASGLAVVISGYTELYPSDFDYFFQASRKMAGNISVDGKAGATIVTGIVNSTGQPKIAWQKITPDAAFASKFGTVVGAAPIELPDSFVVPQGQSIVAVEVFASTQPWILSKELMRMPESESLRSYTLVQPRAALLAQILEGSRK